MNKHQHLEEIKKYEKEIENFINRFDESNLGRHYLNTVDTERFWQKITETEYLLEDIFGTNSKFVENFKDSSNRRTTGANDSPKLKTAHQLLAIIKSAVAKLKREIREEFGAVSGYVNINRIDELEKISSNKFDLIRLVQMCREINIAYDNECYFSVSMLNRSIIDHIPPIFGFDNFSQLVANHKGGRSFKKSMSNLENSLRNIANFNLHGQIRSKEVVPSHSQIDFKSDLDVLIAEVIRLLK